ncbi:hypothetical protein CRI77_03830 [Mycolicibacterium duvalii]|uniref:Uncharacterized protein n=1 Tax=Mycolicibacterium duvalii TaxID=39688 RepID=A0A7I7K9N3_9MYCO|nr:hypothetical protein [Mycolicibacterium duvalii]MCV7366496.1 hypothetical protein [Mycolicibacterium duvalii]PEG43722.1 hypothetical protein CRI77_03830 [Mycolicibacterium duvalii]BBX20324.1 hypothetical protein MDUV_51840 [Mycolicibacterium duvalii]
MSTPTLVLLAVTTLLSCVALGGAIYEAVVVDPYWPKRPGIIQPRNGGIARKWFWFPVQTVLDVLLLISLIVVWSDDDARTALIVAVVAHLVARVWAVIELIPAAREFERANPAHVDESAAARWTRRSWLRMPFDVVTCVALLIALAIN